MIVSASRDKTLKIWEIDTGFCKNTLQGHDDWVRVVIVNEEGTYFASGSSDQNIIIWNAESFSLFKSLKGHEHVIETLAFINNDHSKKIIKDAEYITNKEEHKSNCELLLSGSRDRMIKMWNFV